MPKALMYEGFLRFTTVLYQSALILTQFEGANSTLTVLQISHLEQLNSKIFALPIRM